MIDIAVRVIICIFNLLIITVSGLELLVCWQAELMLQSVMDTDMMILSVTVARHHIITFLGQLYH